MTEARMTFAVCYRRRDGRTGEWHYTREADAARVAIQLNRGWRKCWIETRNETGTA